MPQETAITLPVEEIPGEEFESLERTSEIPGSPLVLEGIVTLTINSPGHVHTLGIRAGERTIIIANPPEKKDGVVYDSRCPDPGFLVYDHLVRIMGKPTTPEDSDGINMEMHYLLDTQTGRAWSYKH